MPKVRNRMLIVATLGFAVAGCSAKGSLKVGDTTPKKEEPPAKPATAVKPAKPPTPAKRARAVSTNLARRARMNVQSQRVEIDDKVLFATGKAELLPESHALLDDVVAVLREHPEAAKIEVAGHTDSTGPTEKNRQLSQDRAAAVKAYLVSQGIASERLEARGYGSDEPLADNDTDEGKEKNRRVEFRVKDKQPLSVPAGHHAGPKKN